MIKSGMTLTSIMVTLALTSVTAVFGTRLVIDQLSLANTVAIMSKGESIFRFFSALVLDSDAWQATLSGDTDLKSYVESHGMTSSINTKISLALRDATGSIMIPAGGAKLKDDIVSDPAITGGWWEIEFFWVKMGLGRVDLILELCLNKATFQSDPKNIGRANIANAYKFLCSSTERRRTRIRYSKNSVQLPATTCGAQGKAVVAISLHSATSSRVVTCSRYELVNTNRTCSGKTLIYAVKDGEASCTIRRTGVNATLCSGGRHLQVTSSGVRCSSNSLLVNARRTRCGSGKVVCGFLSDMRVQCCSAKGPDGVQGRRGLACDAPSCEGEVGNIGRRGPRGDPGKDVEVSTIVGDAGEPGPRGPSIGTSCRYTSVH